MGNNLFSSEITSGDLTSGTVISTISGLIGKFAVFVISIVGFGIVMASILKNCMAGLYAVNPKLWIKVDQVKKEQLHLMDLVPGMGHGEGKSGNQVEVVLGSALNLLLSFLPNVKAMTDFDDSSVSAKQYFMKAIPIMCFEIFVGVFIFFGYPAKLAEKFSELGTGFFDVCLTNVDPVAWIESAPSKLAVLNYATDGAKDDFNSLSNKIARECATTVVGHYDDMQKERRNTVAADVESWILAVGEAEYSDYLNKDRFNMTVKAKITENESDLSRLQNGGSVGADGTVSMAFQKPVEDFVSEDMTTKTTAGKWLRYDLTFTPKAAKGDVTSVKCTVAVPSSSWPNSGGSEIKITFDGATQGYGLVTVSNGDGVAVVNGQSIKVNISTSGNVLTATPKDAKNSLAGATELIELGKIKYKDDSNRTHSIDSITKGTGISSPVFTPTDSGSGIASWTWGSGPITGSTDPDYSDTMSQTQNTGTSNSAGNEGGIGSGNSSSSTSTSTANAKVTFGSAYHDGKGNIYVTATNAKTVYIQSNSVVRTASYDSAKKAWKVTDSKMKGVTSAKSIKVSSTATGSGTSKKLSGTISTISAAYKK